MAIQQPCVSTVATDCLIQRDLRSKQVITAVISLFLVSWFLVVPYGRETLSSFANILLPLLPVCWCLFPGRKFRGMVRTGETQPHARRWASILVGLGTLCFPVGSCIDYSYALRGIDPFPSAADFFYFATYLFLLPGILLVATRGTSNIARGRLLIDSALTVAALSTFSWYFLLGPILIEGSSSLLESVLSAGYPVFDLANLFCVLFVSGRIAGTHAQRVIFPLAFGVLVNITADTWWGYRVLVGMYEVGEVVDAGWPIAYLLMGLALRAHLLARYVPNDSAAHAKTLRFTPLWRSLLPYVLLPAIACLIAYDYYNDSDSFYNYGIYGGSLIVLVLLLVRQLLSIHENIGLNRELAKTLDALHDSHRSLASANAKMAAINRASIDGVMVLNRDWRIEESNAASQQMLGLTATSAGERVLTDLFQFSSTPQSFVGKRTEVIARRSDGSTLPVEIIIVAAELDGPEMFVAFVRDLTQQKEADRIREDLYQRLMTASRHAGMAEVATGVLHNVGNVLNSVNVSASLVAQKLKASEITSLNRAAELITAHKADLGTYISNDKRGQQLPGFLIALARTLTEEQTALLEEAANLEQGLEHIKNIVQAQQSHAKGGVMLEAVSPVELVEKAMKMHSGSFSSHDIEIEREFEALPEMMLDQHKILQILVNLISNAKQAVKQGNAPCRTIRFVVGRCKKENGERIRFQVNDNGVGIEPHMLTAIFSHGYTTKKEGHGFGLPSAANLATEMGGSLFAESAGPGLGATFILDLPVQHLSQTSSAERVTVEK